jgi:hypothetical protein
MILSGFYCSKHQIIQTTVLTEVFGAFRVVVRPPSLGHQPPTRTRACRGGATTSHVPYRQAVPYSRGGGHGWVVGGVGDHGRPGLGGGGGGGGMTHDHWVDAGH